MHFSTSVAMQEAQWCMTDRCFHTVRWCAVYPPDQNMRNLMNCNSAHQQRCVWELGSLVFNQQRQPRHSKFPVWSIKRLFLFPG